MNADLDLAVEHAATAFAEAAGADWSRPARDLEWSCLETAVHIADAHLAYALLVIGRRTTGWVPLDVVANERTCGREVPGTVRATGSLLGLVLAGPDPGLVVWHPYGMTDIPGVASMGVVETLVHAWDITSALGMDFEPDSAVCERAVARLFPEVRIAVEPWHALLWAVGRIALPDHPRRRAWQWSTRPLRPPTPA